MTNEVNFKPVFPSAKLDLDSTHSRVDSGSLHSIQSVDPKSFFDVGFDSFPSPSMRAATPTHCHFASFDTLFPVDVATNPFEANFDAFNTSPGSNEWAAFPSEPSGLNASIVPADQAQDNSVSIEWGSSRDAIDMIADDSQSSHQTNSSDNNNYEWATLYGLHYDENVFGPLNENDFSGLVSAFRGRSATNIQSTGVNFTDRAPGFENNSVSELVTEWYDYFASQSTEGETPYKIFNFSQSSAEDLPQELVDAFQNGDAVKWVVNDSGDLVVGFGQGGGDELKHSLLATHVVGMESWSPQERYEFVVNRPLSDDSNSVVAHSENTQSENTQNSHLHNRSAFAAGELNLVFTQEASGKQLGWLSYDNGSGHFQPEASSVWDGAVRTKINAFVQNALLPKLANVDKINVGFNPDSLK